MIVNCCDPTERYIIDQNGPFYGLQMVNLGVSNNTEAFRASLRLRSRIITRRRFTENTCGKCWHLVL